MALLSLLEIKLFLCASLWSRSRYFIALELGNHFSKLLLSPASLRNGIGLSLWACLLPSSYFLPALLLSFELGNLGFYFPAIFLSIFLRGREVFYPVLFLILPLRKDLPFILSLPLPT